jgi:glycosyltransferase involved in cell wall biosynthesis
MVVANNPVPPDVRVLSEGRALASAGYPVTVIAPRGSGQAKREVIDGIRVVRYRLPKHRGSFMGYLFEFTYAPLACFIVSLRLALTQGFDVVHVLGPPDTLGFVGAVYKLFDKRVVFDHRDLSAEMYKARFGRHARQSVSRVLARIEKACCRWADLVVVPNDSYRARDIDVHGVDPGRVVVVRYGPSDSFLEPIQPSAAIRNGSATDGIIGYVGVIGPQDGVDYLVGAVRHIVDLGRPGIACVIIGYGDALEDVKRRAAELGVDENIVFTGELTGRPVLETLAAADLCVAPEPKNDYTNRSTLVKIMEYMALAKPIVCFDLEEHRVSAGEAALYVTKNDECAFAEAIVELLDQPERRRAMGEYGKRRVQGGLMWRHSVPRLLEAYGRLVRGDVPVTYEKRPR